jgi:CheY-like chemotaxis protein
MGRVLVVDDDRSIISLLEKIIHKKGHQIIVAEGGIEGLALAQSEIPDLVLTDIRMPDMEGNVLAATLKADPRLAHIPVVIMSGSDEEVPGVEATLSKPFDIRDVYNMLDNYLGAIEGFSTDKINHPPD